jgi:hypothetical protein
MLVGVIRIGPTAALRSIGALALFSSRTLSNLASLRGHPFHPRDVALSFLFCEPKFDFK